MSSGVVAHLRSRTVRGLLLVLPLVVTVWVLSVLFGLLSAHATPVVLAALEWAGVPGLQSRPAAWIASVVGVLLTAIFVYLVGLLGGNIVGRRVVGAFETGMVRVPLVKWIYGPARQLLDAFSAGGRAFARVVMLEYPRAGVWTPGFVTSEQEHLLERQDAAGQSLVPVFLPTTPNPTSGWLVLASPRDLVVLDITIEEAMKLIVSGGIVAPADLGRRFRPYGSAAARPAP